MIYYLILAHAHDEYYLKKGKFFAACKELDAPLSLTSFPKSTYNLDIEPLIQIYMVWIDKVLFVCFMFIMSANTFFFSANVT